MRRALAWLPLSYPVPAHARWRGPASVVNERRSAYRSARTAPSRTFPGPITAPVGLHLKPGQRGTKRLLAEYGDRLVCVRYRYDAERNKRFKTVELLVAEREWRPRPRRPSADQIVGLRVAFTEVEVRHQVKQAGGTWDPDRRLWQLPYGHVVALGLTDRIANDPASTGRCSAPTREHPDPDAQQASR